MNILSTPATAKAFMRFEDTSYTFSSQRSAIEKLELKRCFLAAVQTSTTWHQHRRKQLALQELIRISQLEDNWDGEGAIEIAPLALAMAFSLLSFIPDSITAPDVSPNPNGTLSMYWTLPHGSAELEIGKTRHSWVLLNREGRASQTCSGDNRAFKHDQPLQDLIRALSPAKAANQWARPLTNLTMRSHWNDSLEVF